MPRNSSGNYTLPAGNPVVTGTTITSTWANTTMQDIGSEVTNSLDRQGRGSMLAAFKLVDGTVAVPGLSFGSETTTGVSRPSAGRFSISVLAAEIFAATATGAIITGGLAVSGGFTFGAGVIAAPLGTVTAPSFTFAGDLNTGMWSPGADTIAWSLGGLERFRLANARADIGATLAGGTFDFWISNPSAAASSAIRTLIGVNGAAAGDPSLIFDISGIASFAVGIDNSDSDQFKISRGSSLGTTDVLSVSTGGNVTINAPSSGSVLSIAPIAGAYTLNIAGAVAGGTAAVLISNTSNTAGSDAHQDIIVAGSLASDAFTLYTITGSQNWTIGVDNSDADILKITNGFNPSNGTTFLQFSTLAVRVEYPVSGVSGATAEIGWRSLPQNIQASTYTLVIGDRGKGVVTNTTFTTTVPNSVFGGGDVVTIINNSGGNNTIAQGASFTLRFGAAGTGNRTLAANGIATVYFLDSSVGIISGTGLT
jgi:hypothetical protein